MGWTFTHREKGVSHEKFFQDEFCRETEHGRWEILASHGLRERVWLLMQRTAKATSETHTFVCCCYIQWAHNDHYNFGYKDVDESMGPCDHDCPVAWLDRLSAPVNDYSREWREKVREFAARSQDRKLAVGDRFRLAAPMKFSDGSHESEFTVERYKTRSRAYRGANGRLYRITGLDRAEFVKVS